MIQEENITYTKTAYCGVGINLNEQIYIPLNIDKITSLDDVKRILDFLHIEVSTDGIVYPCGYDNVKDLFE